MFWISHFLLIDINHLLFSDRYVRCWGGIKSTQKSSLSTVMENKSDLAISVSIF